MRIPRNLFICVAIILSFVGLVFAASPIRIVVNGTELDSTIRAQLINGQVMVPLRAVAEALGADVRWEPGESRVYITTQEAKEKIGEPTSQPAEKEKKEVTVYITRTGSKYHRLGCRYLSKSCIPISLEDAKARGYAPCKVCNPPQ